MRRLREYFGRIRHQEMPRDDADAVAYPGLEKDYASFERAQLRNPLLGLFQ